MYNNTKHEKPIVEPIEIGNITTNGQPCADPESIIRKKSRCSFEKKWD